MTAFKEEMMKIASDSYIQGSKDGLKCFKEGLAKTVEAASNEPITDSTTIPYRLVNELLEVTIENINHPPQQSK